jgi:FkbM family methyltransferase
MNGEDADYLEEKYKTGNVYVIEAHPLLCSQIKDKYPNYKVFNFAASNFDGEIEFNAINESINLGISSIFDRLDTFPAYGPPTYDKITIDSKRLDTFFNEQEISEIDILKIDVEGLSYEVIEGFGEKIKNVKIIHIENEHVQVWVNQKLYCDVEKLLITNGFVLLSIKAGWPQSDSVWIRNDVFNTSWS